MFRILMCLGVLILTSTPVFAVQTAVVATVAADYSSGAHSVISVVAPRNADNNLLPSDTSDITVAAYGNFFYRVGRYQADHITKFDIAAPAVPIWQYATIDSGEDTSNPHDLVFLNSEKAYLIRYEKTKVWIINPSATTQADFKIGELNLSSYGDQDGIPEMSKAVIVNEKLFITMQRLNRDDNYTRNTAYIAVFNTSTDTEINTKVPNADNVKGIPLPIKNPDAIQYNTENNTIYIQGVGGYPGFGTPGEYSGGIATLNPETYTTSMMIDDGDDDNHPYGNISGMVIASGDKGYFVGYAGYGDNTLYAFDPSTGSVKGAVVDYLAHKDIGSAAVDQNKMLWICNGSDAEVVIINTDHDSIDEKISTNLNPTKIVFASDQPVDNDSGGSNGSTCFISNAANR